jgi:hypothetical protein
MKLSEIKAAKAAEPNDKLGLIMELNKSISLMKPVKIPKLDRSLLNLAIEEAVERLNASKTGNAHDVVFPYDNDFAISTKVTGLLNNHKIKNDFPGFISGIKADVLKDYFHAVEAIATIGPTAELYGRFVYNLIIHFWILLLEIHKHAGLPSDEDQIFAAQMALKGLGVNMVNPRR